MGDGKLSIGAPPQQRIALPTPAERAMLMQIVGQEYPELSPRHMIAGDTARLDPGAANFDHHFVAGLMFLSYVKRSDAVDRERSPWWFLEACRQWLRENHPEAGTLIGLQPFLAAAVASGVRHAALHDRMAFCELGLIAHSFLPAPISTWRQVLESRQLPAEIELPGRPVAVRSRIAPIAAR